MKGSCHCGKIHFETDGTPEEVMECNCSICSRKGALMWFIPRDHLSLLSDPEAMSTYTFNKHVIKHYFCPDCGLHPFGEARDPNGNHMAAINVRCLEDIDLSSLVVQQFDGRSL